MNNIFTGSNKPVKHVGRNGFDLSSFHAFACRPSVVRPAFFQATVPDSSFKINVQDLVRTSSLQTAAFVAGKQDLDIFFVPYRQLYSRFDEVVFGRGDQQVLTQHLDDNALPTTDLCSLVESAADIAVLSLSFNYALKTLTTGTPDQIWSGIVDAWIKAYDSSDHSEQIHQDFLLRTCFFDDITLYSINNRTFNSLHPVGYSVLQHLSSLGYGDFSQRLKQIIDATTMFTTTDLTSLENGITDCVKSYTEFFGELSNVYVNYLNLVAYQKIWREYYRDTILDDDYSYVFGSTCDGLTFQTLYAYQRSITTNNFNNKLRESPFNAFMPRLHQYKKDLNTGLWSSYNYDPAFAPEHPFTPSSANVSDYSSFTNILVPAAEGQGDSAYAMKYALAMQKYCESLMRAGSRTKDLLMSEFGVKSKFVNNTYCEHLGSFSGRLDINKVAATSESGSYSVGDLAANMFTSLQGDEIDFTCNDYGVIIGVLSFVPEIVENAFGLNPQVLKDEQLDFYHADFENLGLVPVDQANFDVFYHGSTHGYGARYYEYKQNLDLAHDTFVNCPCDNPVALSIQFVEPEAFNQSGVDSNYVISKNNVQALSTSKKRSYMLPDVMDNIFAVVDTGHIDSCHFKVGMNVQISAVLPMSVTGMM